jgi:hypothetical protein
MTTQQRMILKAMLKITVVINEQPGGLTPFGGTSLADKVLRVTRKEESNEQRQA